MISKGELGQFCAAGEHFWDPQNFGPSQIQLSPSPENKGGTDGRGGTDEVIPPDSNFVGA